MDREHPGSREQSLFASVELSPARLSPVNRQRARVLGVFHGEVTLPRLQMMMEWDEVDVAGLGLKLERTGLATPAPYNHLRLNPALCHKLWPIHVDGLTDKRYHRVDHRSGSSKRAVPGTTGRIDPGAAENVRRAKQRLTLRKKAVPLWRIHHPDEMV